MENVTINGAQFRDMIVAGAVLLEKNRTKIDALNVFPVPDGDTGSNMSMTMQSAVREIRGTAEDATISEVADALSMGALRGARGNSGVILSQIFRGFSRALKGETAMDAALLAKCLKMGADAAYRAVMKPKEGTILTVSRVIAESVAELAERGANVYGLCDEVLRAGEKALADTPNLLPVLKEAGVVDSGGMGLITIYHGFKASLDGEAIEEYTGLSDQEETPAEPAAQADSFDEENITFTYCTEFFIIHLNAAFSEDALETFREHLNKLGDSVVVAYDTEMVKVHVHSDAPGKILQMALRLGELDHLKIENMREQNRAFVRERKAKEKAFAMVAVSVGEGLDSVFKELAVDRIISGGQTMNPSIETIAKAVKSCNARHVYVLPNNSNIILAAQQASALCDCTVDVLPTKTIPQGIAAAMAFSSDNTAEENHEAMQAACEEIVSGAVTYAVRDTDFNGSHISDGDIIGLMDNDLCIVGKSTDEVSCELLRKMLVKREAQDPIVTVFYGEGLAEENAQAIVDALRNEYGDAEFIVQSGGQPLYYYYFSVE